VLSHLSGVEALAERLGGSPPSGDLHPVCMCLDLITWSTTTGLGSVS
jgi:hypothetical protein